MTIDQKIALLAAIGGVTGALAAAAAAFVAWLQVRAAREAATSASNSANAAQGWAMAASARADARSSVVVNVGSGIGKGNVDALTGETSPTISIANETTGAEPVGPQPPDAVATPLPPKAPVSGSSS